jgi:hypothetical protein
MLDMLQGCSGAAEVSNQATSHIHSVTSNPVQEEKTVECMSHAAESAERLRPSG